MRILGDAVEAVQRNLYALALYLAITVGSSLLAQVSHHLVGAPVDNPYQSGFWIAYQLGFDVFLVLCAALAQAVVFSRLGKQIDRPLWKIRGDGEALRRYFLMWLILNATAVIIMEAANWAYYVLNNQFLALFLFRYVLTFVAVVYVPLGAAIMFLGPFRWEKVPECLRPLWRQFPQTLVVLLLNLAWFLLFMLLFVQTESQRWLRPAIDVAFGYVDCVVFAGIWLICMLDRQEPEEIDLGF